MTDDRAIRWVDRIPVVWMIGAAIVASIVWIVTINVDVKQQKAESERWKTSSDTRTDARNREMEELRTRVIKLEVWQGCLQNGGCESQ